MNSFIYTLACEQALHLGLTRDLFWARLFGSRARFGCEPREDWGGGEVRTQISPWARATQMYQFTRRKTNREWYGFEACPKVIPKIHDINLKSVAFLYF